MPEEQKKGIFKEKPLLLVAPLDWGLGHTTRMIPILHGLHAGGCEVVVACNSTQKALLAQEIPSLRFVNLEGYGIRYGRGMTRTKWKLLLQVPKILIKVKKERLWFLRFIAKNPVSAVISDNRYGLYHPGIPSVLITHQLRPRSGFGKLADRLARHRIRQWVQRFNQCWVPDNKNAPSFSGQLSHGNLQPLPGLIYLGPLSRFKRPPENPVVAGSVLILLSGPEPQRSILERQILGQLPENPTNLTIVRGLPAATHDCQPRGVAAIFNHLDTPTLNRLISESEYVIARAGYTTIMELAQLQKKMILIPTPGQAEQEYLGRHLSANQMAVLMPQSGFTVGKALAAASSFDYRFVDVDADQFKIVLEAFIASLSFGSR